MLSKISIYLFRFFAKKAQREKRSDISLVFSAVSDWSQSLLRTPSASFRSIESLREKLRDNPDSVIQNLSSIEKEKVSTAIHSCRSENWSSLLYYLVKKMKPQKCLELGTCIGLSTAYQALALKQNRKGIIHSIEKVSLYSKAAERVLRYIGVNEYADLIVDDFEQSLKEHLEKIGKIDFAFIDGDHIGKKTIEYFDVIRVYCGEGAVIVFDDIRWSPQMKKAWKEVKRRPEVSLSVDLYYQGIIIINSPQPKVKHLFCPLLLP